MPVTAGGVSATQLYDESDMPVSADVLAMQETEVNSEDVL